MSRLVWIYTFCLLAGLNCSAQALSNFKAHTVFLSSDELMGRGSGTKGIQVAAKYIAVQFESIGLEPYDSSFYQLFEVPDQESAERNIIGIIRSGRPTPRSIVFMAHYDAYGIIKKEGEIDSVYNGARDNAVGVAALIELARMYKQETLPEQNLVFIATAAEEFGTHGSRFYVNNPSFPIENISICLNIDGFNVSGIREDFYIMPRQGIDFEDDIVSIASNSGWIYNPPDWVDGMNTSFDTAPFLANGVPSVTIWIGNQLKGGGKAEWIKFGRIHTPDDEINELWNWEGVNDHLTLYKSIADHFLTNDLKIEVVDKELFKD